MLGKLLEFCSNRGYSDACPHILLHYIMAEGESEGVECREDESREGGEV